MRLRPGLEDIEAVNRRIAKRVRRIPIGETSCDGLAGRFVSDLTLGSTRRVADGIVLVNEGSVRAAMRLLWGKSGIRAEPAAAVGVAALIEGAVEMKSAEATIAGGENITLPVSKAPAGTGRTPTPS